MKKTLKSIVLTGCMSAVIGITTAHGADDDGKKMEQQIQQLTERVSELEKQNDLQAENSKSSFPEGVAAEEDAGGVASMISKYVSLSGAVEVEAGWSEDFEGVSESAISLATAAIGLEAQLTEWGVGVLALEWDDEEDKINVDEVFITVGNTDKFPLYLQAGHFIVPFGVYEGNTIADPLTKEAFETKENPVLLGVESGGFYGALYAFNGDTNEGDGGGNIEQFGATVGYGFETDNFAVDANLGWINSVADSDGLTGILEEEQAAADEAEEAYDPDSSFLTSDYASGLSASLVLHAGPLVLIGEYITALDAYRMDSESEPSAFQLEAGFGTVISGKETLFSFSYSQTDDLGGYLPESRLTTTVGISLIDGLGLGLEYAHDEDYDHNEGGTGDSADSFTVQLAYEF